jgi:hypothetical protein
VAAWQRLCDELTVAEVAADHYTISDDTVLAELARQVLAWLPPELTVIR